MKVVVADDEERVCALICALIDWDRLGLTLCGKAYDGISALALIEEASPDLVITDIRMPGLDGLDLIRRAKEIQPTLQFIIISGHKQFDYAQTAIRYGVAEYLLKPIKKQELEQTLIKMTSRHRQQKSRLLATEQLQQQVHQDRRQKRSLALSHLLTEGETTLLTTCFSRSVIMRIIAVKMDLLKDFHAQSSDAVLTEKIGEYMEREAAHLCSDHSLLLFEGSIYVLLSYAEEQGALILKATDALLQFLKTQAEVFGNILFTLGVGVEVGSYERLTTSVLSSQQAVALRLVSGPLKRYIAQGCEKVPVNTLVKPFVLGLQGVCAQNSEEELATQCTALLADMERLALSPYAKSQFALECFDKGAGFIIEQMHASAHRDARLPEQRQRLENAYSWALLQEAFSSGMQEIFRLYREEKDELLSKPIRKAQEYLALHFHDELISLEQVSEVVNLNSSYLSSLFKKSCNKGFFEYLLELRIAEAKRLLSNSDFSIAEIAQKVGYRDPKHFSKVFKKACHIKPNEYRKLYG